MTNGEINRLGEKICKSEGPLEANVLDNLQYFRLSFTSPLTEIFREVTSLSTKVHRASIVAFRLKRIGTIVNKIHRNPRMKLSRMGDIAGIRCIFYNEREVYKFIDLIRQNFNTKGRIRDYIKEPKEIGYKAVHIHVVHEASGKQVEVQVRTINHHNWATLVEITDLLYDLRLKEIGPSSHPDFAKFHSLLSSDKELTKDEANLIYDVLNEFDFITKLYNTFIRNISEVKKQWLGKKTSDSFHLISVKKGEIPVLESFSSFESAEQAYYEKYKKDSEAEIVLTHIRKPNFQQISIAYSNYILSYHTFMKDIEPIIEQLALEALENENLKKFKKIFITYEEILVSHFLEIISEVQELFLSRLEKGKLILSNDKTLTRRQEKDIRNKLEKTYKDRREQYSKFIDEVSEKAPSNYFKKYLFQKFLKKHTKRVTGHLRVKSLVSEK
ncbi:MAG: RelA/SpoT domain-containing protein [Flavobacteriaceae bacterium]|nr:RelA/SpoT domain-containing protein [Flavobacteriaceae bacterium]